MLMSSSVSNNADEARKASMSMEALDSKGAERIIEEWKMEVEMVRQTGQRLRERPGQPCGRDRAFSKRSEIGLSSSRRLFSTLQ